MAWDMGYTVRVLIPANRIRNYRDTNKATTLRDINDYPNNYTVTNTLRKHG